MCEGNLLSMKKNWNNSYSRNLEFSFFSPYIAVNVFAFFFFKENILRLRNLHFRLQEFDKKLFSDSVISFSSSGTKNFRNSPDTVWETPSLMNRMQQPVLFLFIIFSFVFHISSRFYSYKRSLWTNL